jgi:hypothetical protein
VENRRPFGPKKGKNSMSKRFALVALAAVVGVTGLAVSAEAEVRLKRKNGVAYFEPYYPGEVYVVEPGVYDDEVRHVAFDDGYYDPYYLPPSKKSKKARKAQRAKAAAIAAAREAEAKAKAAKVAKAKPAASEEITGSTSKIKTASVAPETPKKATTTAAVTCEKATSIITGYGFATVEATKCAAPTYEFKAQRDGKDFLIKVSSASGELTEVKKLN